ncbi:MAG: tetratricopeptide repeat protein [Rhodocyclaceae bacterium]|nr:tetratricopeptide repeat protein [Rhodocyclaceae bacterium]
MPAYLKPEYRPAKPEAFFDLAAVAAGASAWIVDPGLAHRRGHHYPLDRLLRSALSRRLKHVAVLCHEDFAAEAGFEPCLRHSIYAFTARAVAELEAKLAAQAQAYREDLSRALGGRITADDALLLPSAHLALLAGLELWLADLPAERRPRTIQLHFHTLPTHQVFGEAAQQSAAAYFAACVRRLDDRYPMMRWSAENPKLAALYARLCGRDFQAVPCPHEVPPQVRRTPRHDGRLRFLFIGETRPEKGFPMIMAALPSILAQTEHCDFSFVVPVSSAAVQEFLLHQPAGRVSVRMQHGLPDADYFAEIAQADVVLCAYDPEPYRYMSSGVVVDAALLAVPIVVTRGMAVVDGIADFARVHVLDACEPHLLKALCLALDRNHRPIRGAPMTEQMPDHHLRQAAALEAAGRIDEAERLYRDLLAAHPQHHAAWHALGLLAFGAGKLPLAAQCVEAAIAIDGKVALYHRNLGEMYRRMGLLEKSTLTGRRACKLAPADLDAHYNLGLAYTDAKDYKRAVDSYRKALKLDPRHGLSWNNLGSALERQGDLAGAEEAYAKAVALDPSHAEAQNNLGAIHSERGRLDEARAAFAQAVAARPDFVEAHYNLSSLKTYRKDDPHLTALEAVYRDRDALADPARIRYCFALGKALDDIGDYDRAFAAYAEGNRLQHALLPLDEARADALVAAIIATFDADFFAARRDWKGFDDGRKPVFIVGMPRSGTTLLEQILCSHASVFGAGELTDLNAVIVAAAGGDGNPAAGAAALTAAQMRDIGAQYVERVWRHSPQSACITDKMPANFFHLGIIHLALPGAKIIHAMRDPMDSCFSCFARLFNDTMEFAYDQGTLGRYYARYMKLMAHWQRVLPPGTILDLPYEQMVADTEGQARRVLEFAGLPWDANCLDFHKNTRLVKTASVAQVRQPIYKTSVARWKHFARHLRPLWEIVREYRPVDDFPAAAAAAEPARSAESWHVEGIALYRQDRFDAALACYERALALRPDFPEAWNSKGFLLQDLDRLEEARDCFAQALKLAPEMAMARLNLGMAQLKLGAWEAGWENYEARWTGSAESGKGLFRRPPCPLPQWHGEGATENLRLLVIAEQGFGDTLQFARYLPLAAGRFARVGFVCTPPVQRLLDQAFGDDVVLFTKMPSDFGDWDRYCPLLSLPRAFGTRGDNIPAHVPYLKVPNAAAAHWRGRLDRAAPGRFRVGIAWAGRKAHQFDARRSLRFEQIEPLLNDKRIAWVSLQKWAPEDARPAIPAAVDWLDWTEELTDFADTAALVASLDLVISIDSAMVHLAGALNLPVWLLNRYDGEWRWLRRREDSPWYPSLRLFNQPAFGDWTSVVAAVGAALGGLSMASAPARSTPPRAAPPLAAPAMPADALTPDQALELAGRHQSAGRLPEAEHLLRQILAVDPANAHALHLLGLVAHQAGQPALAVDLVGQAVAARPGVALFHSNLAEMCRQLGRCDEAVDHGRAAVAIDPAMASAHSNLGIALYDADDLDGAAASHREALARQPGMVQSLNNLGSIARRRKDPQAAADWYRQALAAQPDYLEALSNLGAVLVEDDRAEEAAHFLERALQLRADYPEALCNLGLVRFKMDRTDEAAALLQRSLQLKPGYPEALVGLARVRHDQDQLEAAEALLRQAVAAAPGMADAYCQLGTTCTELGKAEEAEAAYRQALAIDPALADALNGLGNLRLEAGAMDEAEALLREAIAAAPDNVGARFHLVQAKKVKPGDDNLAALEALATGIDAMSADKRLSLHYALGKAYDDLKDFARAFPHFLEGARIKRSKLHYDAEADAARTQRIADVVDADYLARLQGGGAASDVPVFVLGMPRSGTTLTEQIIASHPEVFGAGELADLMAIVQQPPVAGGNFLAYPENLAPLGRERLSAWGADYVARLVRRAPTARRITDKMPANYLALGLIPLMLPQARIVHVKRNPVDTCLSCFTRLFNRHQDATYDLAELGRHYASYARLMQHWRAVLPGRFLEVQYEDIVADMEGQARRLIDFCGLEWDDACLAFHKTKRSIRTASVTQVRQPIYASSVERWRHYEAFLGPLLDALGEFAPPP